VRQSAVYALAVHAPISIFALVGAYYYGVDYLALAVFVFLIQTLGISVGFHRYFSHRGFETYRPIKLLMGYLGSLAIIGGPISWSLVHRQHHKYSDKDGDPHNPAQGFWHSAYSWVYTFDVTPKMLTSVKDLYKDADTVLLEKLALVAPYASLLIAFLVDPVICATLALAMFIVFVMETSLNCVFHSPSGRVYNSAILSPIFGGSSLHKNHHDSYSLNFSTTWYQLDTGYWIIKLIRK
jgi:stearoyl-CoA desaturase (Delta-9 desaturase)